MVDSLDKILIGTGLFIGAAGGASLGYIFSGNASENFRYTITLSSAIVGAVFLGTLSYLASRPPKNNRNRETENSPSSSSEIEYVEETTTRGVHNKSNSL